jgi:hypothetical protein
MRSKFQRVGNGSSDAAAIIRQTGSQSPDVICDARTIGQILCVLDNRSCAHNRGGTIHVARCSSTARRGGSRHAWVGGPMLLLGRGTPSGRRVPKAGAKGTRVRSKVTLSYRCSTATTKCIRLQQGSGLRECARHLSDTGLLQRRTSSGAQARNQRWRQDTQEPCRSTWKSG